MTSANLDVTILIADDDADDRQLIQQAFKGGRLEDSLRFVVDGVELMDYLYRRGIFGAPASAPRPALILLDLNMPRKDGREALAEIKSDPELRTIPVAVLTTSKAEEDGARSYALGADSFITKPADFGELVKVVETLQEYWLQIGNGPGE